MLKPPALKTLLEAPLSLPEQPFWPKALLVTSHIFLCVGWLAMLVGVYPIFGLMMAIPFIIILHVKKTGYTEQAITILKHHYLLHVICFSFFAISVGYGIQQGQHDIATHWYLMNTLLALLSFYDAYWCYKGMNGFTLRPLIRFVMTRLKEMRHDK